MKVLDRGLPPSAYQAYMASPAWAAQKERWRRRHPRQRRCAVSGDRHYDLHHRRYSRLGSERLGFWLWRGDLVPLSRRHHTALHLMQDRRGWGVERATRAYLGRRAAIRSLTLAAWVLGAALVFLLLR